MDNPPPNTSPNPDPNPHGPEDPFAEMPGLPSEEERNWAMFCHLSALIILVGAYPLNIVGPLVIWLMKKDEMPFVDEHGKEALNFQIVTVIAMAVCSLLFVLTVAFCIGFAFLLPMAAIWIVNIVFSIMAGIKAKDGEPYRYPWNYSFLK